MINLLLNEWIKFRASKTILLALFAIIATPLLVALAVLVLNATTDHQIITTSDIMGLNLRFLLKTIGLTLYPYIACDVIAKEYYNDTLKFQLTIPITRSNFYFSKILFATLVITALSSIHFVLSIVTSQVLLDTVLTLKLITNYLFIFFKANMLILPFAYFAMMLTVLFRKKFIPMAITIFMFLSGVLVSKNTLLFWVPWTLPSRIIFIDPMKHSDFPIGYAYMILYVFAIGSFMIGYKILLEDEI